MTNPKYSRLIAVFQWIRRHIYMLLIAGIFIAIIITFMVRGENFLQAVQYAYILLSYFQSQGSGSQQGDPLTWIWIIIAVVVIIGIFIYANIRPKK